MDLTSHLNSSSLIIIMWLLALLRLIIDPYVNWQQLMQGQRFHFAGKAFAVGYLILFFPVFIKTIFMS